jgi:hypothetical protein
MKVYYVLITFLTAFEWSDKLLKCLQVTGSKVGIRG